jgi:uncharacterized protein DUF3383
MSDSTKLPLAADLFIGLWSLKGAPAPLLAAPISATETILTVSTPLKDNTGTIVTGKFLMAIRKANGWTETIWVPAGGASADGKTLGSVGTPVVRGIDPNGTDYTAGDTAFADEHSGDEPVFCVISAVLPEMMRSAIQGLIATGGSDFIIGTDAAGTVTVSRSTGTGTYVGWLRWYSTDSKAQFSNNGSVWTAIDDVSASVLFKVSSADTTPGYGEDKIQAGTNVTITKKNTGANEYLEIATSVGDAITDHEIYAPAYLTGGTSAESNYAIWDNVSDGSFRVTIDGTGYNIDAIDFVSKGITDMDGVAAELQTAIRAATSGTETCVWSTDHFIITSVDTTSSSEVSVLETSTGTVGTDISGAGASDWMDADTGNGTASDPAIDPTADAGKLGELDTDGFFNPSLSKGSSIFSTAGESIDGTTTPAAICVSDGANSRTAGRAYKGDADDFTNGAQRFMGFVTSSVATGEGVIVQTDGVVGGFTGLTPGVKYYLSGTAGGISDSTTNAAISVGYAVSATEILIAKDRNVVQVTASTALTTASSPVAVQFTIGFKPQVILGICAYTGTSPARSFSTLNWAGGVNKATTVYNYNTNAAATFNITQDFHIETNSGIVNQRDLYAMTVSATDEASFTVTWTETGSPGNATAGYNFVVFG